jgi:L-fucose isomerase-like protein
MKTKILMLLGMLSIIILGSCGPSLCDCACSAKINQKYAKECDKKFKEAGSDVAQKILECDCSKYRDE